MILETLDKLNIKFKKRIQYNLELIFGLNYQFSSSIMEQNFNSFPQLLILSI